MYFDFVGAYLKKIDGLGSVEEIVLQQNACDTIFFTISQNISGIRIEKSKQV